MVEIGRGELQAIQWEKNDFPLVPMEGIRIVNSMEELVEFVFPDLNDPYDCLKAGLLSAKNKQIDLIHDYILKVCIFLS